MDFLTTNDYIEANNAQLGQIQLKCVKNRMKNECNMLYKNYHNVRIEQERDKILLEAVELINNTKKRTYKFIITSSYPFHPPKIYINGYTYSDILQMRCDFEKETVKKWRKKDCLCCFSFNCSINWSPASKIYNIIDEINDILKFKKDAINLLLAEKIKIKYNIPYAYFEDYLASAPPL
jgi:hypothetical protein